jgi:hypothetical protein
MPKPKKKRTSAHPVRPSRRYPAILVGLGTLAVLVALVLFVRREAGSNDRVSPFQGDRAFADLETVVAFGPRPSGSEELGRLRAWIRGELEEVGLPVFEHVFDADTPRGPITMVNLWGVVQGTKPGILILSNHYETKVFDDFVFVGANDAGSTTAWMVEMARAIGPSRTGRSVWLVFFDGEEAIETWSEQDGLYGSKAFVEFLRDRGQLEQVRVLINVDMIGDRHLGIHRDPGAPPWLDLIIRNQARTLGYGRYFLAQTVAIQDDHTPFRRAGIPAIDIIDFEYGGSAADHERTWHTPGDTMERVSAASLQVVGDVIYHALPDIEATLDMREDVEPG